MASHSHNTNVTIKVKNKDNSLQDSLSADKEISKFKQDMMGETRWNSFFHAMGDVFKFISAPLFAIGLVALLESSFGATGSTPKFETSTAVGLLGAASASLGIAVGSTYLSSRRFWSSNFNQFEINAIETARMIGKELKKEPLQVKEVGSEIEVHHNHVRADGKKWGEVVYSPERNQGISIN